MYSLTLSFFVMTIANHECNSQSVFHLCYGDEVFMDSIDRQILNNIDNLIEKSPKEAEIFMLDELDKAGRLGNSTRALLLYNELIGYYRQTSEKEKLYDVIDRTCELVEGTKSVETLSYATTMLNIANAYRSLGELEKSQEYYTITQEVYQKAIDDGELDINDLRLAGLYNNMSLLYQECQNYKKSEELLKMALSIVTYRNEGFEIAVTYANLANTMLLAKEYEASFSYAKEAISRFKARNCIDAHFCAALSALASCYYEWGNIALAKSLFEEALYIVDSTIGKNSQYERIKESISMCENNPNYSKYVKGMELSEKYFNEYGLQILENDFESYSDKITVGLVGEGSDCYGFDDEKSSDHDFGPGFCIFVDDDIYDEIGDALAKAYDLLPKEYLGYKLNETALGHKRRGVIKTSDFYIEHLGASDYEDIDFSKVEDYELAVCTNGRIFYGNGKFTELRDKLLAGYKKDIRLVKLAEDVSAFSQTGQYNYNRMMQREDDFTADIMLSDFYKKSMIMYHHLMNKYPPHDKWLKKSTQTLVDGETLLRLLEKVSNMVRINEKSENVVAAIEDVAEFMAAKLYESGDISDIDPYLANHTSELMFKSSVVNCSKKELVDKIARLEFKAFDEVKNEGGRASCQDDWPTFSVMRKSQYLTWNMNMLVQYIYDFTREYEKGHNLITEKYGRMMESTAPAKYEAIKEYFPAISPQKKAIIEQIVSIQMGMTDDFAEKYPKLAKNARSFYTYDDNYFNTSYETYLRGEISTYSDKMLQLYAAYVIECVRNNINIAQETISNTAILYGFKSIEELEGK